MYAEVGDSFNTAVEKLQRSLKYKSDYCDLEFNNIRIRVSKDSNINDLSTIYNLKYTILRLKAGHKE